MGWLRRFRSWLASLIPVPREIAEGPPAVDPRLDADALDAFGNEQIAQFGVGRSHAGSAPLLTPFGTAVAEDVREAQRESGDG
jgi:hypothetical protein